jgi:hypothetical protein
MRWCCQPSEAGYPMNSYLSRPTPPSPFPSLLSCLMPYTNVPLPQFAGSSSMMTRSHASVRAIEACIASWGSCGTARALHTTKLMVAAPNFSDALHISDVLD